MNFKKLTLYIVILFTTITSAQIRITERDVLKKIMTLNPNNTLNWDLSKPNLQKLDGVSIYGKWGDERDGKIKSLSLRNKGIKVLPKEIKHLKFLNLLSITKNNLKSIPEEIGELSHLETLSLEENQLTSLPKSLKKLEKLYRVDLKKNNFTEIPEVLFELKDRRYHRLDITHNSITEIPNAIKKMMKVDEINLSYNKISTLPKVLSELSNLKILRIDHNQISTIPPSIQNIKNLKQLNLSHNNLKFFPLEIITLKNLNSLNLSYNHIKKLPNEISTLKNLTHLNLSDNKIRYIPPSISELKELKYLNFTYNNLKVIPSSLASLSKLKRGLFHGNYVLYTSEEVCNMEYLSAMDEFTIGSDSKPKCTNDKELSENYNNVVKAEISKLFNAYKPTIEEAENAKIDNVKILIGDLNEDDVSDGLVYFTLKESTEKKYPKIAIYNSYEYFIDVIGGFEPDFDFELIEIKNNVVYLKTENKIVKYYTDEYNTLTTVN